MSFLSRRKGQALVEYALILVLIAIVVVVVLQLLGSTVGNVFSGVAEALRESLPSPPEEPAQDCYGSLLLPYLVGLTALFLLLFRFGPDRSCTMIEE